MGVLWRRRVCVEWRMLFWTATCGLTLVLRRTRTFIYPTLRVAVAKCTELH